MAQAGTVVASASEEVRPPILVDIATRSTGDRPGAAQPASGANLDAAAELRQQALAAMEMLREEIATLAALKRAQTALLAWNRDLEEADEGPANLTAALCAEPALGVWCPLLPATFGTSHRGESHDRD